MYYNMILKIIIKDGDWILTSVSKIIFVLVVISLLGSCFQPLGMGNIEIPAGPPEFQAGWHDGCASALTAGGFAAGRFYKFGMGSGIYQHDPVYQSSWSSGWFACVTRSGAYTGFPSINSSPGN